MTSLRGDVIQWKRSLGAAMAMGPAQMPPSPLAAHMEVDPAQFKRQEKPAEDAIAGPPGRVTPLAGG